MGASREKSCGAIPFRERGRAPGREYLLVKSGRHGAWGFPKGHAVSGESERETAMRELGEETGLAGLEFVEGFREATRYPLPGRTPVEKEAVYFLARAGTPVPPAEARPGGDAAQVAWLPFGEAFERLTFADTRRMLAIAERRLG